KILGKHGKNIQAIRTLVNSVSAKAGKRSIIEIIE
ncbi:MAG: KH domain-containing protein, partial [Calditrichia bacterium]|nr:KH domain-containing protein [Calditrichia bacterium]